MEITKVSQDPNLVCLSFEGSITPGAFPPGGDPFERVVGFGCFSLKVLVNLEKTCFIDSHGIGWLINTHKHFLEGGGKIVFHSVPPMVDQVFQLLRLRLVLNIAVNEDEGKRMLTEARK